MDNFDKSIKESELSLPKNETELQQYLTEKAQSGQYIITIRNISFQYKGHYLSNCAEFEKVIKITGCDLLGKIIYIYITKAITHTATNFFKVSAQLY